MRILITGGAGFIGSHLCAALSALGAQTTAIDIIQEAAWSSRNQKQAAALRLRYDLLADTRVVRGDVAHRSDVRDLLYDAKPEIIVHLAGTSQVATAQSEPETACKDIFRTTTTLLELVREVGFVRRFVYVSSSMVYGNFLSEAVNEETLCRPISIYGGLKLSGEVVTKAYLADASTDWVVIRPSAVYGPGELNRRVAQIFCENGLRGRKLHVKGGLARVLDFTYIDDVVMGLCKAISSSRAAGQTFNLTFGQARSLGDLVECVRSCCPDVQVADAGGSEAHQPRRGTLDISKARRLLGYEPAYDLERGVLHYIDWLKSTRTAAAEQAHVHA